MHLNHIRVVEPVYLYFMAYFAGCYPYDLTPTRASFCICSRKNKLLDIPMFPVLALFVRGLFPSQWGLCSPFVSRYTVCFV